jgi:hypothetical protein
MVQGSSGQRGGPHAGIPAGASQSGSTEYADGSGSAVDVRTAVAGTTFTIKATFTYDQDACTVAADTYSNAAYTLTDNQTGTVTLTARRQPSSARVSAASPAVAAGTRTYDGAEESQPCTSARCPLRGP